MDDVEELGHAQLPPRRRESPPPMCITQMLSAAQSTSDPVATMSAIFSASMAVDGAGFFNAMVPPDPQQDSTPESSTRKWNGRVDRRLESEVSALRCRSGDGPRRRGRRRLGHGLPHRNNGICSQCRCDRACRHDVRDDVSVDDFLRRLGSFHSHRMPDDSRHAGRLGICFIVRPGLVSDSGRGT
nr:hypothetical protein [Actinospica robiniae]